ncbi:MAG: ATP-dependent Clp protease proteolytic subunit [Proteobacteria bacterium]|nr:ATP-dependent Clp protease proteolytic subunit [Pseudomonadota bacterium]
MKKNKDLFNTLVPVVVEKEGNYERSYDIYSRLLKDFIIFVTGPIDMATANTFIAQMLFLEATDPTRDIKVYINSPGGEAYSGRAMFDTVRHVKNDVVTINTGLCASAAALLLCSGTKGKRYSLPGAHTMIHQTLGGAEGQATDVEIYAKQMVKMKHDYAKLIADASGKSFEEVLKDIERDNWMDSQETKDYGIIDEVIEPAKK